MVTFLKQNGKGLIKTAFLEPDCWVHVYNPTRLEIDTLENEHNVSMDVIHDILDPDERSRWEKEDGMQTIIIRIPCFDSMREVPWYTIPLGIILLKDLIITMSLQESEIINDLIGNRVKNLDLLNKKAFLLLLLNRSTAYFLKYLKDINRQTSQVERELQQSVQNRELVRLLTMEKSLVYFTTSLKSNELLVEKLHRTILLSLSEEEEDLMDDVLTEHRQAIEMANIYSNILSGLMDAFASVISNNLNVVMKRLTTISIVLMIPTLVASLYGMNIGLPFQHSSSAFILVLAIAVVLSTCAGFLFNRLNKMRPMIGRRRRKK
ncbi:MAG: magnesium transporter CorA family protein [Spirochaetales bacterium]|nr:MAG: magnesium transporter CorA family protein [Spirochaetales bacterium]